MHDPLAFVKEDFEFIQSKKSVALKNNLMLERNGIFL